MSQPSTDLLALQFRYNHKTLKRNLDGIDHQSSVRPGPGGGNSLNWVVGHVVSTRSNALHPVVGLAPIWSDERAAPYRRGSGPLDGERAYPLDELVAELDASQERLEEALGALTDEHLQAPAPFKFADDMTTVAHVLAGLAFHEAYHVGQTGILRRTLGYAGAIA